MAPRTLEPPAPREELTPASGPAPPRRSPLTAAPRRAPTGKLTRRAVVLSVVLHALGALGVLLIPVIRPSPHAPTPGARETVQYLDVSEFPARGAAPSSAALPGEPDPGAAAAAQRDTTGARSFALRFPDRVPSGLPAGGGDEAAQQPVVPGGGGGGLRPGAAGGRLGAQYGDPRLAAPGPHTVERPLTDAERYQQRLRDRLGVLNDSAADEAQRRYRQRNWTIRDRAGREWGLGADGSTIIAGRRLPLPLPLPAIPRDRDADNAERERLRRWGEIQDQAQTQDRDAVLRQRAEETRRRVDSERRQRRGEMAADTTRRRP